MGIYDKELEMFMRESNAIEGETEDASCSSFYRAPIGKLHPNDLSASKWFLNLPFIVDADLLKLHEQLAEPLKVQWGGKYRECDVVVGKYVPPHYEALPYKMYDFWHAWEEMNSYEAHVAFEKIHPFQDLNGRVGRLLWLWKAYTEEGYNFQLSFLHKFYYQTLHHAEA